MGIKALSRRAIVTAIYVVACALAVVTGRHLWSISQPAWCECPDGVPCEQREFVGESGTRIACAITDDWQRCCLARGLDE